MPARLETSGGASLRAVKLSKRFQGVLALDGADIVLDPGKTIGLLGPNGSGKTTLVNCLSGVLPPTSGEIYGFERCITAISRESRAQLGLIRTYQNLRLFSNLSVVENVAAGIASIALPGNERRRRLAVEIEAHGLGPFARRAVGTLSYGLQKRTEIARALIAHPKFLLLDEPAAGLGAEDAENLASAIDAARKRLGCGILLIDHNVAFVTRLASELLVMANGRIIRSGSVTDVLGDAEVARIYLGEIGNALH